MATPDMPNYTPADEWVADAAIAVPGPLQVPSGKTALVRAPGLETFLKQGMIPNTLMAMIKKALDSNSGKAKSAAQEKREMDKMFEEISADPTKLQDLFALVDAATVYCVVKPEVKPVPLVEVPAPGAKGDEPKTKWVEIPFEDREPPQGFLYVDQVDMEDKMFIFNFACAGTRDVERFRNESAAVLGRAGNGKPVARETKRTTGDRRKPKGK